LRSYSNLLVKTGRMPIPPPTHHYEPLKYILNNYSRNSFKIKPGLSNINRNNRNNNRRSLSSKTGSSKRINVQKQQLRFRRQVTRWLFTGGSETTDRKSITWKRQSVQPKRETERRLRRFVSIFSKITTYNVTILPSNSNVVPII